MKHILITALLSCCFTMTYAQNLGVKLADGTLPNTTLDVNGSIAFREGTALSLSNGVNSNVVLGDYTVFRITGPTADFTITGCTGGVDGRVLTIINSTAYNLTIANESTSSAANQINAGGSNTTLAANGVATLVYNSSLTKWIVSGVIGSAPKFSGITNGNLTDSMLVVNNGVPGRVRPVDFIETYAWGIDGNAGTSDGTNFLGTTDNIPLSIRINNQKAGRIAATGETYLGYLTGNAITTGTYNTFIGDNVGVATTTGSQNVGLGSTALIANIGGSRNTALGESALEDNTSGGNNTAVGRSSIKTNLTGSNNTAIGVEALMNTVNSGNTGLGYQSGITNTTGTNNTSVGYAADVTTTGLTNATAIGYNAKVGASNSLVLGGTGANVVNVGIGTTTPGATLEIKSSTALSTGIGVKFRSSTLDSVMVLGNDANFKFRNSSYDFGTDPNNFLSGHYLSSAGFRTFTPSYGRGFFGVESLLASGTTTAASNYYGFRSNLTEESGHSTALNETYSGIFNFNKYGSGNYTFHQNLISNVILRSGSSGTFTNVQAVVGQLTMGAGSANVTAANLFQANLGDWASGYSGTISNLRGLYVNYLGHARVQNAYGIFMEDVTGATSSNYAIYTKLGRVRLGDVPTATDADVVTIDGSGNLTKRAVSGLGSGWSLTGNSGTNPSSNFVGTTDGQDLAFRVNNTERMRLANSTGYVGIGTTSPAYKMHIEDAGGPDADYVARLYNTNDPGFLPSVVLQTARGTKAAPTAVNSGTILGAYRFGGYDGSAFNDIFTGEMRGNATETWSTTAHGTSLYFATIANTTTSPVDRMIIDQNGYIGLGLSSPSVKLHQDNGTATANYHKFTANATTGQTATDGFDVGLDASGNGIINQREALPVILSTSNTERMRILSGGNVGIGLTAPSVKLHQDGGNATATYHKFTAGTTTGTTSSDGFDVGVDASGNAVLNQKEALPLIMSANNAEVMRITSAGNVLIGGNLTPGEVTGLAMVNESASDQKDDMIITTYNSTTTPAVVLFKARGTAAAPVTLTNSENLGGFNVNGYAGSSFRGLTSVATITASDYTTSYGADIAFKTSRSGTSSERMRILSTGNVGIGVTAPSHILQINGQGRATSTTWTTTSDMRLKNIEGKLEYGINELMKINTYRFRYKKDNPLNLPSDKPFQGLMAQELQKIIPEAVTQQADGYLTVNSDPIIWTMVNAIKDLKKENDQLKTELEQAKALLSQQAKNTEGVLSRLEKLEAALNPKSNSEKEVKTDRK